MFEGDTSSADLQRTSIEDYSDGRSVPAAAIAQALRDRLPGVGIKKLHKLLYYCQGHHLATFGRPLFHESISAWDMGPVVGQLWKQEQSQENSPAAPPLDEASLNTVGYVASRYGRPTGRDLENLTHSEPPWQQANRDRPAHGTARIEREWMRAYFAEPDAEEDEGQPDPAAVRQWLANLPKRRPDRAAGFDDPERLLQRLTKRA